MRRGEVRYAQVGRKRRPVLVLTRTEVLDVRELVTVAKITTALRGLAVEVALDHEAVGLDRPSAVNCDGLHTVRQSSLTDAVGVVDDDVLDDVCAAVTLAVGW
ncbi:MAG: type II toxin-antitoxin system PemK/MazF family toxin [Ilumatobacter sp.]|uniref:type II toxin-antitoxin system PemK/MazF family toxin n=1 Tax=Ilumatobacter sp. TaxID=1967498 RepID=UPI00262A9F91|nr:type II toxin-antitoxin system PemK/MazF family toxin [Ilumatobacter sp.]MDJ0771759.1 type II toxin-antitoxin system PemK/MazF family toxin [Ilumatobacter sp.]